MRRLAGIRHAPGQLALCRFLLMEAAWELSMDDTGGPVHHEDLPAGKLLGLLQHRHGVVHVANAVQQRDRRGVLSAQQSDGGQVQRFLKVGRLGPNSLRRAETNSTPSPGMLALAYWAISKKSN